MTPPERPIEPSDVDANPGSYSISEERQALRRAADLKAVLEAIEKQNRKLNDLVARLERMKTLRAIFEARGSFEESDFTGPKEKDAVMENARFWGGVPYPSYSFQKMGVRIRKIRRRIGMLTIRAASIRNKPERIHGVRIIQDSDHNRVLLVFSNRLSKKDYWTVRRNGFAWSPTRYAFVRRLNAASVRAARLVAECVGSYNSASTTHDG